VTVDKDINRVDSGQTNGGNVFPDTDVWIAPDLDPARIYSAAAAQYG
jgi:hypothetical protein